MLLDHLRVGSLMRALDELLRFDEIVHPHLLRASPLVIWGGEGVLGTDFGDRNLFLLRRAWKLGFGYNATVALKRRVFPGLPEASLGAVGFSVRRRFQSRRLSYYVAAFKKALAVAGARPSMLDV
jgi:hypothetical protein